MSVGRTQDHVTPFTVRPGSGQTVELPAMAHPITLKDMKFVGLPKTLAAGTITLKLANAGPSAHEMSLARLDPGKTEQDVVNLFKGPQQGPNGPPRWARDEGGLGMISAHQTAYLTVDLVPGNYVAICTMPDVRAGQHQGEPHAAEGMLTAFTVR